MIKIITPFLTNNTATKVIASTDNTIEILGVDSTDQYKYTSIYQYDISNNNFTEYPNTIQLSSPDIDVPIFQAFSGYANDQYHYICYISDELNNLYWLKTENKELTSLIIDENISNNEITSTHFKVLSNSSTNNTFYILGGLLNTSSILSNEQWIIGGGDATQIADLSFNYNPEVSKIIKINNDYYILGGFLNEVDGTKLFYKITKDENGYDFTDKLADLPIEMPTTLSQFRKVIVFSFDNKIYYYNKAIDEDNFYVYDLEANTWIQYIYNNKIFDNIESDNQVVQVGNLFYIFSGTSLYILNREEMNPNLFGTTTSRINFIKNELVKIKKALKSKGLIMPNRLSQWSTAISNYQIADVSGVTANESDVRQGTYAYTINGLKEGTLEVGETVSLFVKSTLNITHVLNQSGTEDIKVVTGFKPRLLIICNDKFNAETLYPTAGSLYTAIYKNVDSYPKYGYLVLFNQDYDPNAAAYKVKYNSNNFSGIASINTGSKPAFKSRIIIKSIDDDGFTLNFSGLDTKEKSDYAYLFNGNYFYIAVG